MARWFWCFVAYSFFGYLLEKIYARWTRSPRQVRKCFLLLPLCPVYGFAMCACAALVPRRAAFWEAALWAGTVCTATEYFVHFVYDKVFHVRFWDYSGEPGNLGGRVCPRFALIWGILAAVALRRIQPVLEVAAQTVPPELTFAVWLVFAADLVLSCALLSRFHDTELLTAGVLLSQQRASSQSSTSRKTY